MASEPIYKVFVSSTFEDLREERAEVQKALLKLNCLPVGMELFPAADDDTWDFIKEQIDDSDYYVVLVGGRYGSLASDGVSFTEKEYNYAREREVPSIGFVHEDRKAIPSGKTESDPALVAKLDAFVSKIRRRPVRTFKNPHQLASEVTTSFVDLKRTKRRTGFVRTNEAVEYRKYAELLERTTELENRLKEVRSFEDKPFRGHDSKRSFRSDDPSDVLIVTLGDLFVAAASVVIESPEESGVGKKILESLGRRIKDERLRKLVNEDSVLPDETVNTLREEFFARELIDLLDEQVSQTDFTGRLVSYRERRWKLTEYGRRQFALLRASGAGSTP